MSHIVTIRTQVQNPLALRAACTRLGLAQPVQGTFELFAGQSTSGLGVQLPGWRYPIVCDTGARTLAYDNFSGQWGDQHELEKLLQAYAAEVVLLDARRQGHSVVEQRLDDGSIKLTVHIEGGAG